MNLFKYHNINEGFNFQDIADEFNNKQDELENNNGLDTDLDKNNFLDLSNIDYFDIINDFLKRNKPFESIKSFHIAYAMIYKYLRISINTYEENIKEFKENIGKYYYNNANSKYPEIYIIFDDTIRNDKIIYSNLRITIKNKIIKFEFDFCNICLKNQLLNIFKGWTFDDDIIVGADDNIMNYWFTKSIENLDFNDLINILKKLKNLIIKNKNKI